MLTIFFTSGNNKVVIKMMCKKMNIFLEGSTLNAPINWPQELNGIFVTLSMSPNNWLP